MERIVEEEYCLIPMGGTLPKRDQRVVGVGGTAGLVHPSTGYMVARTLGAVPQLADRIVDELATPLPDEGAGACPAALRPCAFLAHSRWKQHYGSRDDRGWRAEEAVAMRARRMWESIWPAQRLRQRAFMNFGMEVILKLNLEQTRQFFSAFFALSDFHWRGFLSSRLSFSELIVFGLSLFKNACNDARLNLVSAGLPLFPAMLGELASAQKNLTPNTLGKGAQR